MTIEKLQKLDLSKVQPEGLQTAVKELLSDFDETKDKDAFKEIAKDNIEKVFLLVERMSPDAIVKEKKKSAKEKKETPAKTTKPPKTVQKELDELSEDIKMCRLKIKRFNEEKRKNEPKKPKPTRHSKIKKHFISIANLIPPAHKDNIEVQKAAEKVLLKAHRGIMNAYKMNTIRAEAVEKAIKDKYDAMEEKATK